MNATKQTVSEIIENLGESAKAILLFKGVGSFCTGSAELEAKGLWNADGELTDLGTAVSDRLHVYDRAGL
jgi:hypothetical protein